MYCVEIIADQIVYYAFAIMIAYSCWSLPNDDFGNESEVANFDIVYRFLTNGLRKRKLIISAPSKKCFKLAFLKDRP